VFTFGSVGRVLFFSQRGIKDPSFIFFLTFFAFPEILKSSKESSWSKLAFTKREPVETFHFFLCFSGNFEKFKRIELVQTRLHKKRAC
jgi:hypothetical protein